MQPPGIGHVLCLTNWMGGSVFAEAGHLHDWLTQYGAVMDAQDAAAAQVRELRAKGLHATNA